MLARISARIVLLHRHSVVGAMLMLVLCALLAGCSSGSQPFAKLDGSPSGKPVPPINLIATDGLPADKLPPLKDALAQSAGKRDMAIVEGAFDTGTFGLSGTFHVMPEPAQVRLAYSWTLTDKAGTVLHTIAAEEAAPGTPGPDPWILITPAVLQRVAAYTAESLSSRLSQLGYATQVGGLPPPLENYAAAGPGAEHDIDYETLYGPGRGGPIMATAAEPPQDDMASAEAAPPPPEPEEQAAEASPESAPKPDETAPEKPKNPNARAIKAVAVLAVKGAPGSGNAELTVAMRETLSSAGWPVITKPRDDALTISGNVKIAPANGPTQRIALAWTVASPDGQRLGTINQANDIPAGSLDSGWGETAIYAAQAAATGIFDLVKKFR